MFFICFIWTSPEKTGSRERHVSDDTRMWSFLLCSSWWCSGFRGWSCTCRVWICQAAKCRHSDHILVLYNWSRTPLKPGTPVWWPGWGWGGGEHEFVGAERRCSELRCYLGRSKTSSHPMLLVEPSDNRCGFFKCLYQRWHFFKACVSLFTPMLSLITPMLSLFTQCSPWTWREPVNSKLWPPACKHVPWAPASVRNLKKTFYITPPMNDWSFYS